MHQPPKNNLEKEYQTRIRKVLNYIQENLSVDVSLASMAEVANFSPFHFQKLFKEFVGETPKQYIIRLRLEKIAHHLTLFSEIPVYELSFQNGFSSPSVFSRAFRQYYGVSPDEFRKLTHEEISKICTSKNKISKEFTEPYAEFWNVNFDEFEPAAEKKGITVEVVKMRSLKIAYFDTHLGDEESITNAFRSLLKIVHPWDLINQETMYFGILLDLPFFTELSKCRFRACITISADMMIPREIAVTEIPGNKYATFITTGNLANTIKSLVAFRHTWLEHSGYQIAETIGYEMYQTNPLSSSIDQIERKIFIPIKPA